jgi:hypothetical protein
MKAYWKWALDGGERSASRPCHFSPRKTVPRTNCIEGWVGPTVHLGKDKNLLPLPGIETRLLEVHLVAQLLSRLHFHGWLKCGPTTYITEYSICYCKQTYVLRLKKEISREQHGKG